MIKPFRSLLLLVYVGVLLGVALYFLPPEISLPNGDSLRFFTINSLFETKTKQYADISGLEKKFTPVEDKVASSQIDTTSLAKTPFTDTLEARFKIQYPEGNDTILYT